MPRKHQYLWRDDGSALDNKPSEGHPGEPSAAGTQRSGDSESRRAKSLVLGHGSRGHPPSPNAGRTRQLHSRHGGRSPRPTAAAAADQRTGYTSPSNTGSPSKQHNGLLTSAGLVVLRRHAFAIVLRQKALHFGICLL